MNIFNLSDYNTKIKMCWWTCFSVSILVIAWAFWGLTSLSTYQTIFFVSCLAIIFIGKNLVVKIPQTQIYLWLREPVILLSLIWVGVPGAVLLSAVASFVGFNQITKSVKRNIVGTGASVIATFISGQFFVSALSYFEELSIVTTSASSFPLLFGVLFTTFFIHYAVFAVLPSIFLSLRLEKTFFDIWKEYCSWGMVTYLFGLIFSFIIHVFFIQFGTAVGFLFVPLIFVMNLANRFYSQTLLVKTEESSETTRIHLATIEALATAIDARDQVGVGHARRVQIYAIGMGEVLGLSEDELNALHTGALLHDIGKLAVPDHILNKPGRLTPAEMEKTKVHASVGAAILEKVNFPYPVVPTVLHHHENWDGTGYPHGLSKEEIPLTARILAVADAYDTLCGARPYRASLTRDEARRYLLNSAGKQFDPRLVDVFLRNWQHFDKKIEQAGLSYKFENKNEVETESETIKISKDGYLEQIKRANREVYTLYELARVFSGSLNLEDTLKLFVEKVKELVPFDTCIIYLYKEAEGYAIANYTEGKNAELIKGKKIKPGEGATGYVLKNRQAVHNINPVLDFSFGYSQIAEDFASMASLPLIVEEKLIGAISLYSCELESYEDDYMRLLETITRIASDAIAKSVTHLETENRALTDQMTNLPNARSLQLHFEKEVSRSRRTGYPFQVIMLDLDGFKAVNDTFGHKVGDKLLLEVGKVMKDQLREYDFLARYAGDEFVAIIPEMNEEDVREICDRIEKSVSEFQITIGDRYAKVGISIGSASYPRNGESLDQIIVAADQAMYAVKAHHKQKLIEKEAKMQEEMQIKSLESAITVMPEELIINEDSVIFDLDTNNDGVLFELDESHIISNSVN
ncbi:MAG: diguanylate cyclase [Pyrinomonadaceae bacterium]|nr:diguanylate cyclase [Pyrinomonadaceae bacterium]